MNPKNLIIFLALSLSVLACKKKCKDGCENGGTCVKGDCECPVGYTGDRCETKAFIYYFDCKINGTDYSIKVIENNNVAFSVPTNYTDEGVDTCHYDYTAGLADFNDNSNTFYVHIHKYFSIDCYNAYEDLPTVLSVGSKAFFDNTYTTSKKAELVYIDANLKEWRSSLGDQTGSAFSITASTVDDDDIFTGVPTQRVSGTVNCKVYDGLGSSKTITDGDFVIRFYEDY